MVHPIHIIQHSPIHGPGYLEKVLQRRRVPYEIYSVTRLASKLAYEPPMSGLVLLGGPFDTHNRNLPWLQQELRLIEQAISHGTAVLGHGFGAELIATALDSQVVRSPVKQIGWFTVKPADNDAAHAWLEGIPKWLEVFKWRGQSFDIPPGALALLKGDWSLTEAFVLDNILAFQGHLEIDHEMLAQWLHEYSDEVAHPLPDPHYDPELVINWDAVVQGPEMIYSNLETRLEKLHQAADLIYDRWLTQVLKGAQYTADYKQPL